MTTTVMTRQGRLEGEMGASGVAVFRGVPYARPPVGALRFRAPEPPVAWTGTLDARRFGPAAPQDKGLIQYLGEQSEDCLRLNLWTPALDGKARPVMVWIHGGGFRAGSAGQEVYDGSELALRGDVVVVTLNYRLAALGFAFFEDWLGVGAETAANNGLRDQIAALRWVQENIAEFAGDPENVTVFGESAGAMSVGALLSAPSARGLFRRAIAQSGAAHHATTRSEATRMAELIAAGVGAAPAQPERLWSASVGELIVAQRACWKQSILRGPTGRQLPQGAMTLIPVGDGELLPESPFDAIAQGSARDVDVLVGSNLDEWNYFVFLTEPDKRELDEPALLKICNKRILGRGAEAIALYRSVLGPNLPAWKIYCAIESDRMFRIPALRLAEAQSRGNANTFMYLFDWHSPLFQGQLGACHAIDLPFVFGTVDGPFGRAFTGGGNEARALALRTLPAFAQFARTGNPSHEGLETWAPYEATRRITMRLGASCRSESAPLEALRPFWDDIQ